MDFTGNEPQERWGYIPPFVIGHRRASSIRVAKLLVAAALADFDESEPLQNRDHLARL
jgi:hypothetical protein